MIATTTLSEIRTLVRQKLDDDQFDGDSIDRAINDYQRDLVNRHKFTFMESTDTTSVGLNSATMDLPDDFQQMLSLVRTSSPAGLITKNRIDYDNFMQLYPTYATNPINLPNMWTTYGGQVRFSNPANGNYNFQLDYLAAAPYLTQDTDICVVPDEFTEVVVQGALNRIFKIDDDYDIANNERPDLTALEIALISRYGRGMNVAGPKRMMTSFRG
jgi:hypothetical protein